MRKKFKAHQAITHVGNRMGFSSDYDDEFINAVWGISGLQGRQADPMHTNIDLFDLKLLPSEFRVLSRDHLNNSLALNER